MNESLTDVSCLRSVLADRAACLFPAHQVPVVLNRLGLDGGPMLSLEVHGDHLGVTRERVRQMEARAVRLLSTEVVAKYFDLIELGAISKLACVFEDIEGLLKIPTEMTGTEFLMSQFFKNIFLKKQMRVVNWAERMFLTNITDATKRKIASKHREISKASAGRNACAVSARQIIEELDCDFLPTSTAGEWFLEDFVCIESGDDVTVYGLKGRLGSYFGKSIGSACEPMSVEEVVSAAQAQMSIDGFGEQEVLVSTAENWLREHCHLIHEGHFGMLSAFGHSNKQMSALIDACCEVVEHYPQGFEFPASALYEKLSSDLLYDFAQSGHPVTKFSIQAALLEAKAPGLHYLGRGVFIKNSGDAGAARKAKRLVLSDLAVEMLEAHGSPLPLAVICQELTENRQGDFKQISDHSGRLFAPAKGLLGLKSRDRDVPIRDFLSIEKMVGDLESLGGEVFEKDLCERIAQSSQVSEVAKSCAEKGDLSQLVTFGPFLRRNSMRKISVTHGGIKSSREVVIEGLNSFNDQKFSFEQLVAFIESNGIKISRPDLKYWLETNPCVHGSFASGELIYVPEDKMDPWFSSGC